MAYQHRAGLTGQELSSAVVQQLLQSLPLYSYLSHVLTHTWAGLYQDCKALEHDNMHVETLCFVCVRFFLPGAT